MIKAQKVEVLSLMAKLARIVAAPSTNQTLAKTWEKCLFPGKLNKLRLFVKTYVFLSKLMFCLSKLTFVCQI